MRSEDADSDDSSNVNFSITSGKSPKVKPRVRYRERNIVEQDFTPNAVKSKSTADHHSDDGLKIKSSKPKKFGVGEKMPPLDVDSDSSFVAVSGYPIDNDLENLSSSGRNSLRRNKKISKMKNRKYERDRKRFSGEFATEYHSLSLPSPGHYRSLVFNKSASAVEPDAEECSPSPDDEGTPQGISTPRKNSILQALGERSIFYKNFSVLVQMGDNAMKRQDIQRANSSEKRESLSTIVPEGRQRPSRRSSGSSTSRPMVSFGDYLWLNLQAWSTGKCMKPNKIHASLDQMDDELIEKRCQKLHILQDLKMFVFDEPIKKLSDAGGIEPLNFAKLQCDPRASKIEIFNNSFVDLQNLAIRKVYRLLKYFEELESLFPNRKAFLQNLSDQFTPDVEERLNVLLVWYNITRDLCRKIKIIGRLLEMHKAKDKVEWPNLDYESPGCSRAPTPQDSIVGGASPLSPNVGTSDSSGEIHRSVSDLEFVTTATMYKQFVEKSLKLRGMRKALARIADSLGSTLWRAKQALQKRSSSSSPPTQATPKIIPKINELSIGETNSETSGVISKRTLGSTDDRRRSKDLHLWAMQSTGKFGGLVPSPRNTLATPSTSSTSYGAKSMMRLSSSSTNVETTKQLIMSQWSNEFDPDLINFGVNNSSFQSTNLPSFYPSFLFLLRVPLNLVHEWLKLRIEQKSSRNPDPVTLDQLIQDCHDCLAAAVEVKSFYQEHVQTTTEDGKCLEKFLIDDMSDFETDLTKMFDIYLDYVQLWANHQTTLHNMTSEWSQSLINRLEEEWKFAKKIAINILSGEAVAAKCFCHVSKEMYDSIEQLLVELSDKLNSIGFDDETSDDDSSTAQQNFHSAHAESSKKIVFKSCRIIRTYVHEIRERSLRALTFAKLLRNDLEIATKYELRCDQSVLLDELLKTNHYLVQTVNFNPDFMMFCKDSIADQEDFLQLLLNVTCGRDEREIPEHIANQKGCLLLIKCGTAGCDRFARRWNGKIREITPNADTNLALHNLEVDGVFLVVSCSDKLKEQRFQLKQLISPDFIRLVDEQCSCHGMIAENMQDMKNCAMNLRKKITNWLLDVEEEFSNNKLSSTFDENERQTYRDALIQAYNFAFEYHKELSKLVTGKTKDELIDGIREFAHQWTRFVRQFCERGHGARPRWATDGFNFLVFAVEPSFTKNFTDSMFNELKRSINECVEHVIGSRPDNVSMHEQMHGDEYHRTVSWPPSKLGGYNNKESVVGDEQKQSTLIVPSQINRRKPAHSEPSSSISMHMPTSSSMDPIVNGSDAGADSDSNVYDRDLHNRILNNLYDLEYERERKLLEDRRIGRCIERREVRPHTQIASKRANFKWQRLTTKIGAGKYGSVYTAINLDSGQLMAMKQIKFQQQDHQAMQALVDEVTNFEGIQHDNLVRYFGVEVHRDELFIFMEFCNEGTLEKLCRDGLSDDIVRTYTLHLLTAVCELHRRGIVHRDIKTANIFLTNEYQTLKLGDFGSSVRLKDTTTVVGELTTYVGTPAYMAPEVCASNVDGYGRAADIWSVGCVVLEMATGKPPWHDLNNMYAIIFKVGNGASPNVPETLSVDCKDFLSHCFTSKGNARWSAEQLLEHPFVKVRN